ncbi:pilus assembly protein [Mesobaculum littorinae]|uniref:Pilus assembly protein n=1 Tax=Mesobaculum littorinae TaxID=2486419 RepID=A0A438AJ66_9RHOB|nr:TadE family protein [Mesobaculum littorinae]RVV98647.1 pilus assembly protein [Mesobaculum littorinae]
MFGARRVSRLFGRFAAENDGSATVEGVLWLPIFFAFFVGIADASLIFFGRAQALQVTQDANRFYSIGRLDADGAEAYIENALSALSARVQATTSLSGGIITTQVIMPSSDLVAVGFITALTEIDVSVTMHHVMEN